MEAIVLAGGLGTRLRAEVPDRPKPMAPVAGRPFLEILLEHWIAQGVTRFVLSVGYLAHLIQAHFGTRFGGAEIAYALETSLLGTGGGVLLAARQLRREAPFLVMNGDTYLDVELRSLAESHSRRGAELTVAFVARSDAGRYAGIVMQADGRVNAIGVPGAGRVNGGVYLCLPGVLERAGFAVGTRCSLEADILPALITCGARIFGQECAGSFVDIGVPDDYRRAGKVIFEGKGKEQHG